MSTKYYTREIHVKFVKFKNLNIDIAKKKTNR